MSAGAKVGWVVVGAIVGLLVYILAIALMVKLGFNAGPAHAFGWPTISYREAVGSTVLLMGASAAFRSTRAELKAE